VLPKTASPNDAELAWDGKVRFARWTMDTMIHGFRDVDELVYHYTSADTAFNHILKDGTLRLGSYAGTNDPKESKTWQFSLGTNENRDLGKYKLQETSDQFSALLKANAKLACFATDSAPLSGDHMRDILNRGFCKPRMWAQYADKHQGVCLAFRKTTLLTTVREQAAGSTVLSGNVAYRNVPLLQELTAHEFMINCDIYEALGATAYARAHLQRHSQALFFQKLQDWRDESEWRIVVLGTEPGPLKIKYRDSLVGIMHGADLDERLSWALTEMTEGTNIAHMGLLWKNSTPWYNYEAMRWSAADRRSPWSRRPG
jgi:hypothetical protein